jgi:hypothetical protein
MSPLLIGGALVAAFIGIYATWISLIARGERRESRETLIHGEAAIGRVVQVVGIPSQGKVGARWTVTVEFVAADHPEPVRFDVVIPAAQLFSSEPKPIVNMNIGQAIPVHYRRNWPGIAVIDSMVK